jgi:hypothetical protein
VRSPPFSNEGSLADLSTLLQGLRDVALWLLRDRVPRRRGQRPRLNVSRSLCLAGDRALFPFADGLSSPPPPSLAACQFGPRFRSTSCLPSRRSSLTSPRTRSSVLPPTARCSLHHQSNTLTNAFVVAFCTRAGHHSRPTAHEGLGLCHRPFNEVGCPIFLIILGKTSI